jgi:hypothetical protein
MELADDILDIVKEYCHLFVTEKTYYAIRRKIKSRLNNYVYVYPLLKNEPNTNCNLCKSRKCGK